MNPMRLRPSVAILFVTAPLFAETRFQPHNLLDIDGQAIAAYRIDGDYAVTQGDIIVGKADEIGDNCGAGCMIDATKGTAEWLKAVVRGYFQYQAVLRNERRMKVRTVYISSARTDLYGGQPASLP
jgi:hypothetical protein